MLRPWKTIFKMSFKPGDTLVEQITDGIRNEIIKGRLERGAALPGSRILAADIGVNRKTVVFAYEALIAEGWLESKHKSGTFVSENLPVIKRSVTPLFRQKTSNFAFNHYDPFCLTDRPLEANLIVFNEGAPDARLAPLKELSAAYKRVFHRHGKWRLLGYGSERGDVKLREEVAIMLSRDRGVHANVNDICITRGSQMAIYLAARVLVQPGDKVVVENPGYYAARKLFLEAGAQLRAIDVDSDGIDVDALEALCRKTKIKAVYVTPHHQFPTTVSMKAGRRIRLLELSLKYSFAIIEDDYDHEFHFGAGNNLALASSEMAANVIYISSLSKLIAPAIRVGYIKGPAAFMQSLVNLRVQIDRQGDAILEHAIAELMEDGTIGRHARKASAVYKERRDVMESCLKEHFGESVRFRSPEGGLACWIQFQKRVNFTKYIAQLKQKGIQIVPPGSFYLDQHPGDFMRLGYGSLNEQELAGGIKIMSSVYHGYKTK
ncbi:MocR-like pyridoxine biosynthesis transcription factor PdxR [Chitinophaga arvensicola]|uniref:Transcriptional regulator, GntR family n=1 Tax=Chitinophaga arvensicola TaxID=29529 RepID=A0A1I0S8L9_9BACT|nr:PLP-dependent aminotransferase family protein [Chitinophaga arvensicola]SEW52215.1 transcriptional regulator, GntR family [Chitinophaga arvensicola]